MYITVFPTGKGPGGPPVNYFLSECKADGKLRQTPPVVVKGDPETTRRLIDSIDRVWKYTSGIIAWAPGEIVTPAQEAEFVREFESIAFAGLKPDQYNDLWVRHLENDGHELHFLIPRTELTTGKAFNAFAPGWQKHFDPLRDKWNIEHGWSRPDNPSRARLIQHGTLAKFRGPKKEAIEILHAYALREVTEGRVNNRAELVTSFREAGLEVTREGGNYVTVQLDDGSKHRLKGAVYEQSFERQRFVSEAQSKDGAEPAGNREDNQRQLAALDAELEQIRKKRALYNESRYQKADGSNRTDLEPGPGTDQQRDPELTEEKASMAASAVALRDHLNQQLGNDSITDLADRKGPGRETGRYPDHERDPSQRQDLGGPDERNQQRPLPDPSPGSGTEDGLHLRRPGSREDYQQVKGDSSHGNRKPNIAKPGSSPPPRARRSMQHLSELGVVHDPRPCEVLLPRDVPRSVRQHGAPGDRDGLRRSERPGHWQRLTKEQYKQMLIQQIMGTDRAAELWNVRWVDQGGRGIDFKDDSRLEIGDKIHTARGMSDALAAKRLIASNKAAGWTRIGIEGPRRFIKLAALEALRNGIEPVPADSKQARIIDKAKEIYERDRARTEIERGLAENADRARRANASVESASEDLESASERISESVQRSSRDLKPRLEAVMRDELDEMKLINIADYLVSQEYQPNKAKSSQNALCYYHSNGDRLIVGTDAKSGHSVYYSVRDDQDNGTIIHLIQKRQSLNLGQVRRQLRPWIGRGPQERSEIQPQPRPEPTTKDRQAQARGLAACEPIGSRHKYLESRAINSETLKHFRSRIYTDTRGNAVFPHFDAQGVTGLEIKNTKFTGFSKAGEKGLWLHGPADPQRIVVVESVIDAMSHYQLDSGSQERGRTLYISTAGKMSPESKASLQTLLDKHRDLEIVAGFANNADGDKYTGEIQGMAAEREIIRHRPHKNDWNEDLQLHRQLEEERERRQREREEQEHERHRPSM